MAYQSRKRNYRSRRERLERASRNTKVVLIFATIGAAVWVFMIRHELWAWLKTYFY